MLRSSANCSVIWVLPSVDTDAIESMPAMVENCRSSGVATAAAIVSGLAPGSDADTWMVGKSTLGRSLTGKPWYATVPKRKSPSITSVVITGRSMKSWLMIRPPP